MRQDEYGRPVLNPLLHPWPPKPAVNACHADDVAAAQLAVQVEAQLDAQRQQREERLVRGGYTDKNWRRIMLKHYGEDYEGMQTRAVLRAREREAERSALAVDSNTLGLTAHSTSRLDHAMPGCQQREERLVRGGYTDKNWRRIMLKHYGEDYEGMQTRAVLRAREREAERSALAVDSNTLGLTAHSTSRLDHAMPGCTASFFEGFFSEFFPSPLSPEQRRCKWTLSPDTARCAHIPGSLAPGRFGLSSRGHLCGHVRGC